jgi:serine/threonine protein phosphatase 1
LPKLSADDERLHYKYPAAPDGCLLYVVGDIHGRSDCLRRAHELIEQDADPRPLASSRIEIYLGDYVDRGPDSKGVIDMLIERSRRVGVVTLRGNHEILMESFLRGFTPFDDWRAFGGLETILSYGVDARAILSCGTMDRRDVAEKIPFPHFRFISNLRNFYRCGDYLFVHAGVRPGLAIEAQSIEDLTQIRQAFLNHVGEFGAIVVHGHTPVRAIEFRPNRINLDTGAYMTNQLAVIRIDRDGASALTSEE